jgi:hypothetical protein
MAGSIVMTLRLIDGMRELALDYDGFILDLWGVVHDGTAPFPGVLDCMGRLIAAGKRIVLLSNAPRRADDVVRRIARIGAGQRRLGWRGRRAAGRGRSAQRAGDRCDSGERVRRPPSRVPDASA